MLVSIDIACFFNIVDPADFLSENSLICFDKIGENASFLDSKLDFFGI